MINKEEREKLIVKALGKVATLIISKTQNIIWKTETNVHNYAGNIKLTGKTTVRNNTYEITRSTIYISDRDASDEKLLETVAQDFVYYFIAELSREVWLRDGNKSNG